MKEYIGIDIGGTKIAVVKGDEAGNITKKIRFENRGDKDASLAEILRAVRKMGTADAVGISPAPRPWSIISWQAWPWM